MKRIYSIKWLQSFFDSKLENIEEKMLSHLFEVEDIDEKKIELDVLANRADCLSHYGIAKELGAIYNIPLNKKYLQKEFEFKEKKEYIDTEKCDRYSIIEVENCEIDKTPDDVLEFLEDIGQQSINPIVDLTNYIMFLVGHPIHAFDKDKISGEFSVRQGKGEKLTLLNNETIVLDDDDVVICDNNPIALAGVMGGSSTKVEKGTKNICIEVASFDKSSIRETSRRHNIQTDSSSIFSYNVPAERVGYTADVVCEIFSKYGDVRKSYDSLRVKLPKQRKTGVSVTEINNTLGTQFKKEEIEDVFKRFGFKYEYINPREKFIEVAKDALGTPYKYGSSVLRDDTFDCSSLICYAAAQAGLSIPRISVNQYLFSRETSNPREGDIYFIPSTDKNLKPHTERIIEKGFPTSPGSVEKGVNHCGIYIGDSMGIIAEGNTGENKVIKQSTDGSIIREIFDDEKRFVISIPVERQDIEIGADLIEEVGRLIGYDTIPSKEPSKENNKDEINREMATHFKIIKELNKQGFSEIITYSFRDKGDIYVKHPVAKDKGALRKDISQNMKEALEVNSYNGELLGLDDVRLVEIGSVFNDGVEKRHIALGVSNVKGRGKVDIDKIEDSIRGTVKESFKDQIIECDVPHIKNNEYEKFNVSLVNVKTPSKYPFVLRDISLFVKEGTKREDIEEKINKYPNIKRINFIDQFEKDGNMSFTFRIVFQSDEKTLNNDEVNETMKEMEDSFTKEGHSIR